jgi:hypothetical protein
MKKKRRKERLKGGRAARIIYLPVVGLCTYVNSQVELAGAGTITAFFCRDPISGQLRYDFSGQRLSQEVRMMTRKGPV